MISKDAKKQTFLERLKCGAISGLSMTVVCYPLEITRARLALAPHGTYCGIGDCIRKISVNEGFTALYAGMVPAIVGVVPYAAVEMGIYNQMRDSYS